MTSENPSKPKVTVIHGPISILTMEDDSQLNLLSLEMAEALAHEINKLQQDPDVKVLILTGSGQRAFCAGADMRQLTQLQHVPDYVSQGQDLMYSIENFPVPTIAAINGFALGAGFSLALACDFRVVSQQAKMGQLAVRNGLIPPFGNIQRLIQAVGPARTRELVYTGRSMSAAETLDYGLAISLSTPEGLLQAAMTLAEQIAASPGFAIRYAKQVIETSLTQGHVIGYAAQEDALIACLEHPDSREIMLRFLDKN